MSRGEADVEVLFDFRRTDEPHLPCQDKNIVFAFRYVISRVFLLLGHFAVDDRCRLGRVLLDLYGDDGTFLYIVLNYEASIRKAQVILYNRESRSDSSYVLAHFAGGGCESWMLCTLFVGDARPLVGELYRVSIFEDRNAGVLELGVYEVLAHFPNDSVGN